MPLPRLQRNNLGSIVGLIRMFAPVLAQRQVQNATAVFALLIVLLAIGIF
jgi:hypothetical protein